MVSRNLAPLGLCTVLAEYPGLRFACPGLSNLAPFGAEVLDGATESHGLETRMCRYQCLAGEGSGVRGRFACAATDDHLRCCADGRSASSSRHVTILCGAAKN